MKDPETSADVFRRLLFELRRLWNDLQGSRLLFEIFSPSYYDSSDPDPRVKELATLCFVNLPLTSAVSDFTISPGWVFVREIPRDDARIERLRKLFREAGAHLPSDYLIRLHGYTNLIAEPASRWVALICFVHRIHTCQCQRQNPEEHAGREWHVWYLAEHFVVDPVQCSIELIEQLRLNTENPVPIHEVIVERPWPPDADCSKTETQESFRSGSPDSDLCGESRNPDSSLSSETGESLNVNTRGEKLPKRRKDWPADPPPDGSRHKFGPLTGTLTLFARLEGVDPRSLYSRNEKAHFYIRKQLDDRYEIWFDSQRVFAKWNSAIMAESQK